MQASLLQAEEEWQTVGKVSGSKKAKSKGKTHHTGTGSGNKKSEKAKADLPHDCSTHAHVVPSSGHLTKLDKQVAYARSSAMALRECEDDTADAVDKLSQQIRDVAALLQETLLWKGFLGTLEGRYGTAPGTRPFAHMLVLGVGSFATQPCALLQLALAYLLLQTCITDNTDGETGAETALGAEPSRGFGLGLRGANLSWHRASAYDPVFTTLEKRVCEALGLDTSIPNKKGKYKVPATGLPTLCFMPHCPYSLCGSLLWENWEHLRQLVLIGNSISSYMLRSLPALPPVPEPPLAAEGRPQATDVILIPADCIALAASAVTEVPLYKPAYGKTPPPRGTIGQVLIHVDRAFNDTCVLWFAPSALLALPDRPLEAAVSAWNQTQSTEMG